MNNAKKTLIILVGIIAVILTVYSLLVYLWGYRSLVLTGENTR